MTPKPPYRTYLQALLGFAIALLCLALGMPALGAVTAVSALVWLCVAAWQHIAHRQSGERTP